MQLQIDKRKENMQTPTKQTSILMQRNNKGTPNLIYTLITLTVVQMIVLVSNH